MAYVYVRVGMVHDTFLDEDFLPFPGYVSSVPLGNRQA